MTTQGATTTWQAPGPGMWERDEAHQSAPFSRYTIALFDAYFEAGIEEGSQRYGLLFQTFDVRWLDGWAYMRPRIVGAPEKPGGLPPRWLFKLMFKLHPALRARTSAARKALTEVHWRQDAEWWVREGRAAMRSDLRALQSVDLSVLDDDALRRHHAEVLRVLGEGFRIHFRNALAHWIGVGDWLARQSEWTGTPPDEALQALEGASPFSINALVYLDRIVAAIREAPAAIDVLVADSDPDERLRTLVESSPAVAAAVTQYLDEHGWRIFTGFDVMDQAVIEMPESVLRAVAGRLDSSRVDGDQTFAAELRRKVPSEHLAEYDALFETARLLYGVRDDDAGLTAHWTMGLARRLLLEVGNRMVERGRLRERDLIFDASIEEVDVLLGAPGTPISGEELASRAAARAAASAPPPGRLGVDEGPPPPDDWMPPAVARVNGALMLAMSIEVPAPVATGSAGGTERLQGLGASPGVVEGRACVVSGPDDFGRLQQGDVLVAPFTTTSYNVILPVLGGVVTDKGGILSHAAIVAREYRIPAVVNTSHGTASIPDGARIRIDGATGTVEILALAPASGSAVGV